MKPPTSLRKHVKTLLDQRGHSYRAAEKLVGMDLSTLSNFVKGRTKRFTPRNAKCLAKYVGIPYEIVKAWMDHDARLLEIQDNGRSSRNSMNRIDEAENDWLAVKTGVCDKCPLRVMCTRDVHDGLLAYCERPSDEDIALAILNGQEDRLRARQNLIRQMVS